MSEKLVRDNMPELCNAPDMTPMTYRVATQEEMQTLLLNKLHEEVAELEDLMKERGKGTKTLYDLGEELCDIKEVIESIAVHFGLLDTDVEIIQKDKKAKKGGFKERIVWDGNK